MESFFITANVPGIKLDLHVNLWDSEKNNIHCLDIGVKCDLCNSPYQIKILLPQKVNANDFVDLYDKIIDDTVARLIFNSDMNISGGTLFKNFKKNDDDKAEPFLVIKCDKEMNDESKKDQTELLFNIPAKSELEKSDQNTTIANKVYFRFRIKETNENLFSVSTTLKSRYFEVCYEQNKIIDFRVNDLLLLPDERVKELRRSETDFEKIHFLYLNDIDANILYSSPNAKARLFEKEVWKKYLEESDSEMMAYHLSVKKNNKAVKSGAFLLKTQKIKTSWGHIVIYALIVILLAVLANLATNAINSKFNKNNENKQDPNIKEVSLFLDIKR